MGCPVPPLRPALGQQARLQPQCRRSRLSTRLLLAWRLALHKLETMHAETSSWIATSATAVTAAARHAGTGTQIATSATAVTAAARHAGTGTQIATSATAVTAAARHAGTGTQIATSATAVTAAALHVKQMMSSDPCILAPREVRGLSVASTCTGLVKAGKVRSVLQYGVSQYGLQSIG